jgi:vitamin B12 transporter
LSHVAEIYANITASEKLSFIAGTDLRSQKTDQYYLSISDFGPFESKLSEDSANIKVYSAYASAFFNSGNGFFMEAGGRWNNHSMYGNNFTYSLNPSFVKGRWKIFVNIASAFKAPTLYQLYDAMSGEPGLNPEKSTSFEGGLQYSALEKAWQSRVSCLQENLRTALTLV